MARKHFIQLKTACGCTREFEVPTEPGIFYEVPFLVNRRPFNEDEKETELPPIQRRRFRRYAKTRVLSGTIYEYVEILEK
jgi:hypothetical protein